MGFVELCRAITKQAGKPKEYDTQYIDITFNGRIPRVMVDTAAKANIMTKKATKRLKLSYSPSLRTVNGRSKHHARRVAR